jgi:hypothetical protein
MNDVIEAAEGWSNNWLWSLPLNRRCWWTAPSRPDPEVSSRDPTIRFEFGFACNRCGLRHVCIQFTHAGFEIHEARE